MYLCFCVYRTYLYRLRKRNPTATYLTFATSVPPDRPQCGPTEKRPLPLNWQDIASRNKSTILILILVFVDTTVCKRNLLFCLVV